MAKISFCVLAVAGFFVACAIALTSAAPPIQSAAAPSFLSEAVAAAEGASAENDPNVKLEDKFGYCPRRCARRARETKGAIAYPVCMNRCICSAYCDYSMSEGGLTAGNYRLCVGLCVLADPYSENPQTWDRDPACCPADADYVLTPKDKEFGCNCL